MKTKCPDPGARLSGTLLIGTIISLVFLSAPIYSQEPPQEPGKTDSEIAAIPTPIFGDPKHQDRYQEGRNLLTEEKYSKAKTIFKRLKSSLRSPTSEIEKALERCLLEAEAGAILLKVRPYVAKERYRTALNVCLKADPGGDSFEGSFTGEELEELRQQCIEEIYHIIDEFEKTAVATPEEPTGDDEPEERGPRGGGNNSGYGRSAKIVGGSREDGDVRTGKGALHWMLSQQMSFVTFNGLDEIDIKEFRYLNISLRSEDPKARPSIVLLFDVDSEAIPERGGRGRRGWARAGQRDGFQLGVSPTGRWQDLRLDLRKFVKKGEVDWEMVQTLRLIHYQGGEAMIMVDDIRLERG